MDKSCFQSNETDCSKKLNNEQMQYFEEQRDGHSKKNNPDLDETGLNKFD